MCSERLLKCNFFSNSYFYKKWRACGKSWHAIFCGDRLRNCRLCRQDPSESLCSPKANMRTKKMNINGTSCVLRRKPSPSCSTCHLSQRERLSGRRWCMRPVVFAVGAYLLFGLHIRRRGERYSPTGDHRSPLRGWR